MKQKQNTGAAKRPRIKKGDMVIVMSGEDARTRRQIDENGEGHTERETNRVPRRVLAVYPRTSQILVEGVNVVQRSYKKGAHPDFPDGGIHDKEMPIHISNVMLADPKTGEPTRVGVRTETRPDGSARRIRYAKASGTDLKD